MEVTFWGVRGSFPVARPHVRRLGGNTSCIEVRAEGMVLVIDAGTGIRRLGRKLVEELQNDQQIHMLVSHAHWDHIQGFPFFEPAYHERFKIHIRSCPRPGSHLADLLSHQQDLNFFSVPLSRLDSKLDFGEMDEDTPHDIGPFRVTSRRLNHPGVSGGFRIEQGKAVFAYICDVAPSRDLLMAEKLPWGLPGDAALKRLYQNQLALAEGADLVVYDTFFTPTQYEQCKHWGHSTLNDGIEACLEGGAHNLAMFHHNPDLTDEQVLDQPSQFSDSKVRIHVAREGDRYNVSPGKVEKCV